MTTRAVRPFTNWFLVPVPDSRRSYPPEIPPMTNGVYALADLSGRVLYVGESHTGRLYDTLTRHLRHWFKAGQWQPHYDRNKIQIAWRATRADEAQTEEALLIAHYKPRDNTQMFVFAEEVADDQADDRELTQAELNAVALALERRAETNPDDVPF